MRWEQNVLQVKQICIFQACNFIKEETLAQMFSYEFCKIFKNTFSYRTPLVAASVDTVVYKTPTRTLETKLYTKDTDRQPYIHHKSEYPESLKRSIPFG